MKITAMILRLEDGEMKATIGKPLRDERGVRIGEVISAEAKGDYVEVVCELDPSSREIYNKILEGK